VQKNKFRGMELHWSVTFRSSWFGHNVKDFKTGGRGAGYGKLWTARFGQFVRRVTGVAKAFGGHWPPKKMGRCHLRRRKEDWKLKQA